MVLDSSTCCFQKLAKNNHKHWRALGAVVKEPAAYVKTSDSFVLGILSALRFERKVAISVYENDTLEQLHGWIYSPTLTQRDRNVQAWGWRGAGISYNVWCTVCVQDGDDTITREDRIIASPTVRRQIYKSPIEG